jgi:hypothetical protein
MTKDVLEDIMVRWRNSQPGPWKVYIEGKDHTSGSNFIMTGEGSNRGEDIEMFGATNADYEFIANAKQDIPKLINEIERLTRILGKDKKG